MTASVITKLAPITEDMTWTKTPYALEIKGKPEKRVTVNKHLNPDTGATTVHIVALAAAGTPVLPLSTLDQIARNILPGARIRTPHKADNRLVREYAVI
jgi:hypothetical protein